MISQIIKLLQAQGWHDVSERVEFAKGKREYIFSYRQLWHKIKRQWLKR